MQIPVMLWIRFYVVLNILCVAVTELTRRKFSGCRSFDISDNMFVDEDKLLSFWIRHDTSLRHLNVSCLDHKLTVPSILDAVAGMIHPVW